jgi:hypothetical protein
LPRRAGGLRTGSYPATGDVRTWVLGLDLSGSMVFGCDPDGNSRVGGDIERQANCFDQDRETFGGADAQAGLLAAAVDIGKALRTASLGRALFSPRRTASRSVQSPMNFGLKRAGMSGPVTANLAALLSGTGRWECAGMKPRTASLANGRSLAPGFHSVSKT